MSATPTFPDHLTEVLPGLFRVEIPLHHSPLRSINSYVVPTDEGNLIVDTGMRRPECREALFEALSFLKLDLARTTVLTSHLHADHLGLIGELAQSGAKILIGREDLETLKSFANPEGFAERLMEMGVEFGLDSEQIREAVSRHPGLKYSPEHYPPMDVLLPGEFLKFGDYVFEAIHTPGHTPGHLCLFEKSRNLLLSGDHILGDITPNITRWPGIRDSLGDYLDSLQMIRDMGVSLALPGHRSAIDDVQGRIDALRMHHEERLQEVLRILSEGGSKTVCEVASAMSWDIRVESWSEFPVAQKWFACGEAASHLDYLLVGEKVSSDGTPPRWGLRKR